MRHLTESVTCVGIFVGLVHVVCVLLRSLMRGLDKPPAQNGTRKQDFARSRALGPAFYAPITMHKLIFEHI